MFTLLREDRSPSHPTGWVAVGKYKTVKQAEAKAKQRELMMAWQSQDCSREAGSYREGTCFSWRTHIGVKVSLSYLGARIKPAPFFLA